MQSFIILFPKFNHHLVLILFSDTAWGINTNWQISWNMWAFPQIGVPPVIIHFLGISLTNHSAMGVPPFFMEKPPYHHQSLSSRYSILSQYKIPYIIIIIPLSHYPIIDDSTSNRSGLRFLNHTSSRVFLSWSQVPWVIETTENITIPSVDKDWLINYPNDVFIPIPNKPGSIIPYQNQLTMVFLMVHLGGHLSIVAPIATLIVNTNSFNGLHFHDSHRKHQYWMDAKLEQDVMPNGPVVSSETTVLVKWDHGRQEGWDTKTLHKNSFYMYKLDHMCISYILYIYTHIHMLHTIYPYIPYVHIYIYTHRERERVIYLYYLHTYHISV